MIKEKTQNLRMAPPSLIEINNINKFKHLIWAERLEVYNGAEIHD
jgi:hypothetical protein